MSKLKDLLALKSQLEEKKYPVPAEMLAEIAREEELEAMKNNGCVYILKNKYMPDLVKIGYTDRSLVDRCNELYSTGVPCPFDIFAYAITPKFKEFESAIHRELDSKRVNAQREFFQISPQNAFNTFLKFADKYQVIPTLYSVDGVSALNDYERLTKGKRKTSPIQSVSPISTTNQPHEIAGVKSVAKNKDQHDDTIYSWDGKTFYAKSRFVFEIVARLLRENSSYTFEELLNIMPQRSANNRTLIPIEEWEQQNEDAKRRYVKDILTTSDHRKFLVSSQWGFPQMTKKIYPLLDKIGFAYTCISYEDLQPTQILFKRKYSTTIV